MTEIQITDAAAALIKADVSAFKRDGKRYGAYVAEMAVTSATVADHVALFRDAFRASFPKSSPADPATVKAYATKVRNGLNYWIAKAAPADESAEDESAEGSTGDEDESAGSTAPVDYLAVVLAAADQAISHGLDAAEVRRAVEAWSEGVLS